MSDQFLELSKVTDKIVGHREEQRVPATLLDEVLNTFGLDSRGDAFAAESSRGQNVKEFIKAAPLFLQGRTARISSAIVYSLDQVQNGNTVRDCTIDGLLGAGKGCFLKLAFDKAGSLPVGFATKALAMGLSSRGIETILDRHSFTDSYGQFSMSTAKSKTLAAMFNGDALFSDIAVFGFAHGGTRLLGKAGLAPALESRLLGSTLSGAAFGASSGFYQELAVQHRGGNGYDFGTLAKKTAVHAGMTGLAGLAGGLQSTLTLRRADLGPLSLSESAAHFARLYDRRQISMELPANASGKQKFSNYESYCQKGVVLNSELVNQYSIAGHDVKLLVPKVYDDFLAGWRTTREKAAQPLLGGGFDQMLRVARARIAVDLSSNKGQYMPEDIVAGVDRTPDSRLMESILVLGRRPAVDYFFRQHFSGTPPLGQVTGRAVELFKNAPGWDPTPVVLHEWSHIEESLHKAEFALFEKANEFDAINEYQHSDYANFNMRENWAFNSEAFLGASHHDFVRFARLAPMRTMVMAAVREKVLAEAPDSTLASTRALLRDRLDYVDRHVRPKALQELTLLSQSESLMGRDAAALLEYLTASRNQVASSDGSLPKPDRSSDGKQAEIAICDAADTSLKTASAVESEPAFARKKGISSAEFLEGFMKKRSGAAESDQKKVQSERVGQRTILSEGTHEVMEGLFEVRGNARVLAKGKANIFASGNARIQLSGNAQCVAEGEAVVTASEHSRLTLRDKASATVSGDTTVFAFNNSSVIAGDHANVTVCGNARVTAGGRVSVIASDQTVVQASGKASVNASGYAEIFATERAKITGQGAGVRITASGINDITIKDGQLKFIGDGNVTASGSARLVLGGTVRAFCSGSTLIDASNSTQVYASDNARVRGFGDSLVSLSANATGVFTDRVTATLSNKASATAADYTRLSVQDSATANLTGHAAARAIGDARLVASESSTVEVWGTSRVVARGDSKVIANDRTNVELFDRAHADATSLALVTRHDASTLRIGGRAKLHVPTMINGHTVNAYPELGKLTPSDAPIAAYAEGTPLAELYKRVNDQVVHITAAGKDAQGTVKWTGSGFFVSRDGLVGTAFHVVEGAQTITIRCADGTLQTARVLATDPLTDTALLSPERPLRVENLPELSSKGLKSGDALVIAGFPDGVTNLHVSPGTMSRVTSLREVGKPDLTRSDAFLDFPRMLTSCYTHPGNSGGPIFNADGSKILGVTSHNRNYQLWTMGSSAEAILRLLSTCRKSQAAEVKQ